MIKIQFRVSIEKLRLDIGNPFCQNEGKIHESSCVQIPQNGIAERKNRNLLLD